MNGQQLKNSILQMAVQGKLVPQDPNDEPASVLIQRIREEKEKLIKEKKIKKEKNPSYIFRGSDNLHYEKIGDADPVCIEEQMPFEIPDSWQWIRLATVGDWGSGATPSRTHLEYYGGDIPWLKTGDLNDDYIVHIPESITKEALEKTSVRLNPKDSVLIAMYGATIGKLGILTYPATTNQACCACLPIEGVYNKFLFYFLMSHKTAFIKRGEGGAQPNISKEKIIATLMPLPPITEQQRIVAKIEQILPHIKEYELSESRIGQLNAAFPEQLKKSILQDAVQGKLVPQDPSDEPASILLERIREEKARLVKEGKIKKDKNESFIFRRDNSYYEKLNGIERCIDKEIPPFEIPDSWEWVRAGTLFQHNTGKALNASNRTGKLLDYITTSNLYWGKFELNSLKQMFFTESEIEKCTATTGDLLVCEGGDVGRAAIWNYDYDICIQNHVHKLRAYVPMSTKFFFYLFYFYKKAGLIGGRGIGIQGLSSNALHALLFPLPPVTEQNRIVKEIEALFPLCSKLK